MISVIIPTLNEQDHIAELLIQLENQTDVTLEIIVADGGSTDRTRQIVTEAKICLVETLPGRGKQMNAGARSATGDYFLFLHADTRLSHDQQLSEALAHLSQYPGVIAGHFPLLFDSTDGAVAEGLKFFEAKTRLNRPGTFNGDQGLLIRRKEFNLLDGFSEKYTFLEDQDFGQRFSIPGRFITLPSPLITSARRFEQEGLRERIILNTMIMGMFHLELDSFFEAAPEAYRENTSESKLDLSPFFSLVLSVVFAAGFFTGLRRCYGLGRYAAKNLWQVFLWLGLRRNDVQSSLQNYNRFIEPLTNNPIGYFLGMMVVLAWFFTTKTWVAIRSGKL